MPKPTSILGSVETKEIKLGAGRIFRGGVSATFLGTAKFDTNSLGSGATGWEDMMAIANDATIQATANMYKFMNGVPATFKKGFVTGRDAQLSVTLDEFRSRAIQTALGLNSPINKLSATLMTISGSPTATVFTVDTVSGLAVGDELVVEASSGLLAASTNSGIVDLIASLTITLRQALRDVPAATWVSKKRVSTKLPFGGSDVKTYPLIFVVDFVQDKKQFVAFAPKVSSAGSFNPGMGGGADHAKIGLAWDIYGQYDSDLDDNVLFNFFLFEDEA